MKSSGRQFSENRPVSGRIRHLYRLCRVLLYEFRFFLICSFVAFWGSVLVLYNFYPRKELPPHHQSFLGIAYDVVQMTFFQMPIPFVDDWRLIPVFFCLPILGLLVIAEGVVQLGHLLLQHRTNSREWQQMLAASFENHIVVAGMGNVGFRVMQHLKRYGENVVCIERDADASFLTELEGYDVPAVIGDVTNTHVLEKAGIKKAKAFLAVTDNDLANIEAALTVRDLAPGSRIIIRVFDQRLAQKVEKNFGINGAFSASALSAPVFAQAALSSNLLASFEFAGTVINAFQLNIEDNSPLKSMQIDRVRGDYEVTVLMHQRGSSVDWNPAPATVLQTGDKVLIVTDNKNIQTFISA